MVWSKRSRQGGALEGSKWPNVLVDSAFRGLQGTSCGEAHAGPRYCWNISHYMANKLLYSDNSSLDFFCENVIGISWEIATFWGCCSGGSITREELARWPGGRAPSTVFFPNTSAWHCFSMWNPEYRRIERINKDIQLILYSPGIRVIHRDYCPCSIHWGHATRVARVASQWATPADLEIFSQIGICLLFASEYHCLHLCITLIPGEYRINCISLLIHSILEYTFTTFVCSVFLGLFSC